MTTYSEHEQRMLDQQSFREDDARDIARDIVAYNKALPQSDGWRECLRIEKKYHLDGLPPSAVSDELYRLHLEASGK